MDKKTHIQSGGKSVTRKYLADELAIQNVFNYKVATSPTRKIPVVVYIAHRDATYNNTKSAKELAQKHLTRLCSQLQRLDIGCSEDTRGLLHTSLTKMAMADIEESVFTLLRSSNSGGYVRLIILDLYLPTKDKFKCLDNIRSLGAHIQHGLNKNMLYKIQMYADPVAFKESEWFALAEGFIMSMYHFPKYGSSNGVASASDNKIDNYYWHVITSSSRVSKVNQAIGRSIVTIRSMFMCQDLVNEPRNKLQPLDFIAFTQSFIKRDAILRSVVSSRVYSPSELKSKGFNLLYSIGAGSPESGKSRLLILKYNPLKSGRINVKKSPELILIGKGVTVNTCGVSLKPAKDIPAMKSDMSGAAIVLSSLLGYAKLGGNKPIMAMIPLAENLIGNKATVPGDVLKSVGGKTVEIVNTDAEGRLLLADCLSYASSKWPRAILVDISTLTGEQEILSCKQFNTFLEQNVPSKITHGLVTAGKMVGEPMMPLPLKDYIDKFEDNLESQVADTRNIARSCSGQIYPSTVFLSKFIDINKTKWIHIDVGGNTFNVKSGTAINQKAGASGVGVRVMLEWLLKHM